MGRYYPFESCGKAFVTMPYERTGCQPEGPVCNLDLLLDSISNKITKSIPYGAVVSSTDMFLELPQNNYVEIDSNVEVSVVTVPCDADYARNHGVYLINSDNSLANILFKADPSVLSEHKKSGGDVLSLVAGLMFLNPNMVECLLVLHTQSPLDACTYYGVDSGVSPINLSLFFDFVLPMCSQIDRDQFLNGHHSTPSVGLCQSDAHRLVKARTILWKKLHGLKTQAVMIKGGRHIYQDLDAERHRGYIINSAPSSGDIWRRSNMVYSYLPDNIQLSDETCIINSLIRENVSIGEGCVISNCKLATDSQIGEHCVLNGVDLQSSFKLHDNMVFSGVHTQNLESNGAFSLIYMCHGVKDNLHVNYSEGSFFNKSWEQFTTCTGISPVDIWDSDRGCEERSFYTARLFCEDASLVLYLQSSEKNDHESSDTFHRWKMARRFSIAEILSHASIDKEFSYRRRLAYSIGELRIYDTLIKNQVVELNQFYSSAVSNGFGLDLLKFLDDLAYNCGAASLAARIFANIADVLGVMSANMGGLRSGPAENPSWSQAFAQLEVNNIKEGVLLMKTSRADWLTRPDLLVRAARHYEKGGQILIRHAVCTARQFMNRELTEKPPFDVYVTAECPARADLAGGWSDTPPITYENGGAVMNIGITVDGQKPIGARAKRIKVPEIHLRLGKSEDDSEDLKISQLHQMSDYCQPFAPCALLKTAFICSEVVEYPSSVSLKDQLMNKFGGGFFLTSWSDLPTGSGLGTSSILAGAIIGAIWKVCGRVVDKKSLVHAVLIAEQMLTCGGGWQDQVGGIMGGLNVGHSAASLPLHVEVTPVNVEESFIKEFNDRFVCLFSGKPRLARNLLQNVVRKWYSRNPSIVDTENSLKKLAWQCASAFEKGDLEQIGECMNEYWVLKKRMAADSEPRLIREIMEALRPHTYGMTLAGAGGGGFLYVLTRKPHQSEALRAIINQIPKTEFVTFHSASIDMSGITFT